MKLARYQAEGFYPKSGLSPDGLKQYPAAAVAIKKGDYLIADGSGYATNTATAVQTLALGIANEDCDNSAGSAGDKDILVIPLREHIQFSVPVEANAVITRAIVGDAVDLESNDGIDISDTTITAGHKGFMIDDIDVSAEAIAANTYGYAIGHFEIEE